MPHGGAENRRLPNRSHYLWIEPCIAQFVFIIFLFEKSTLHILRKEDSVTATPTVNEDIVKRHVWLAAAYGFHTPIFSTKSSSFALRSISFTEAWSICGAIGLSLSAIA